MIFRFPRNARSCLDLYASWLRCKRDNIKAHLLADNVLHLHARQRRCRYVFARPTNVDAQAISRIRRIKRRARLGTCSAH